MQGIAFKPRIKLTITPGLLYSPSMFRLKLKYLNLLKKSLLPLFLFAGCFIVSAEEKDLKPAYNCGAAFTESATADKNSNGVTPSKGSPIQTNVWLVAVDLGSTLAKNSNQKYDKPSGFVPVDISNSTSSSGFAVNTLSQVNADLGRLFTLVGEKPSGTS